jgi:ribonuclease D
MGASVHPSESQESVLSVYRWIDDEAALDALVGELASEPVYGLDTEFHRERTYYPLLALVQIAWSGGVALVDPFAVDLKPLAGVLDGPGLAVLHAGEQDLEVLTRACGTVPARLFDTQLAAGFIGMSSPSLANLAQNLLGRTLSKGDRLTDWTRRPLTSQQRTYAAADVVHLLELHQALVAELQSMGRLRWAETECEIFLHRSRAPVSPNQVWWRMREARSLRGRARAVAQCVLSWRELRAAELDKPPRFLLPDLSAVSIANRPPRSSEELAQVRGLEGRRLKPELAAELLMAVEEGMVLPDSSLCLPVNDDLDPALRPAAALAAAWVNQRANELQIDATLLATRADLHAMLRGDPDCRLAQDWRARLLGAPLRSLVAGEAALGLAPGGGLVLEERSRRALVNAAVDA